MIGLVDEWLRQILSGHYDQAAALWPYAPLSLGVAFSRKLARYERLTARELRMYAGIGEIYRIEDDKREAICDVGVLSGRKGAGLTSAQAVTRRHLSANWKSIAISGIRLIAERPSIITESVRRRVETGLTGIRERLAVPQRPFDYYVPTRATYSRLGGAESAGVERGRFGGWSWFDPFACDVVSRDPTDIHELVHGCAAGLDGWTPPVLREGLAECFAATNDYRYWEYSADVPDLAEVWSGSPRTVPGWYSAAAVFTASLYDRLGKRGFVWLWNGLDENDSLDALAASCGTTAAELAKRFDAEFLEAIRERRLRAPSGLLGRTSGRAEYAARVTSED